MKGYPIWVFSDGDECEILVGRGIDRDVDLTRDDLTGLTKWLSDGGEQPTAYREKLYDPTNGDIGSGDLISIVRPRG